ncbi:MAG: deoxyribose-phosphate aldolase [Syntrophomonadaceae bacterium]
MLASYLDSTNLKPDAGEKEIADLCRQARQLGMAAVCINPFRVPQAVSILSASQVKVCTVIGFPLGADRLSTKVYSADQALRMGAQELDMVINIGAVKDRRLNMVEKEIKSILRMKEDRPFLLKVIVETALLDEKELAVLTRLVSDSGADFIKTSTGLSSRGVNLRDLEIIKQNKSPGLKIKASGGIKSLDFACELLQAGADRLGSSNASGLVEEYRKRGGLLRR